MAFSRPAKRGGVAHLAANGVNGEDEDDEPTVVPENLCCGLEWSGDFVLCLATGLDLFGALPIVHRRDLNPMYTVLKQSNFKVMV